MLQILKHKWNNLNSDAKFSEILTGSAWALSAQVIATGLGLLFTIIVARFYGAEALGILAVIRSFLMLATIFTILGTSTSILRLIPEHLANYSPTSAFKVYRKIQYIVICASLGNGIVFFFTADLVADKVFSKPHLTFFFSLAAVFIVFGSLMQLYTQAVRGLKFIRVFSFMIILPQGSKLILLILLGLKWSTIEIPVYAMFGGFILTAMMGCFIIEKEFKKKMRSNDLVQHISIREIFSISLPMVMTSTMVFIIGETGVIMLGMFRSEAEVGHFAVAVKLATMTAWILQAINSIAAPKFSELFHSGKIDELFYVAKKSAKLVFWSTAPMLIGFVVLGKPILSIIFGTEFSVAYPALVILVIGQFVNSISGSTALFMNMTGNQKIFRNIMIISSLINISLNWLLIPHLGIHGAAIAGMITLCYWNIFTLVYIKFKFGKTTCYFPTVNVRWIASYFRSYIKTI